MKAVMEKELKAANLQCIEITFTKMIQLFETKNSRHAVMIVGLSGSGKSVTWKMLRNTLTRLRKENKGQFQAVKVRGGASQGNIEKACKKAAIWGIRWYNIGGGEETQRAGVSLVPASAPCDTSTLTEAGGWERD